MKKIKVIFIVIILIILLLLMGCQQEVPAIKAAQLTENEKELLRSVGVERYIVFDVDLSRMAFQKLEYRVVHYEKGKLVEHLTYGATSVDSSEKKKQRLIWSQIKTGRNQDEVWTVAFAGSRMSQQVTLSEQIRGMSWSQK